jgi:hypothetical protein
MASFRILNQFPVYLNRLNEPDSGGTLRFFDNDTNAPKDVFGDADLSVNNGSSVLIGTDGRTVVDIWGSGVYRVRLYDVDDTLIAEAEDVEIPGGSGTTIPSLVDGYFLTNDGALLLWAPIIQPPDPTGSSGKILGTDGVNLIWQSPPATPNPPFVPASNSIKLGTVLIQWGTGTLPASGAHTSNVNISFPTVFNAVPFVAVNRGGPMTSSGFQGTLGALNQAMAGFTASADINVDADGSAWNINSDLPFTWLAVGTVAA